jgi:hypothetical protein
MKVIKFVCCVLALLLPAAMIVADDDCFISDADNFYDACQDAVCQYLDKMGICHPTYTPYLALESCAEPSKTLASLIKEGHTFAFRVSKYRSGLRQVQLAIPRLIGHISKLAEVRTKTATMRLGVIAKTGLSTTQEDVFAVANLLGFHIKKITEQPRDVRDANCDLLLVLVGHEAKIYASNGEVSTLYVTDQNFTSRLTEGLLRAIFLANRYLWLRIEGDNPTAVALLQRLEKHGQIQIADFKESPDRVDAKVVNQVGLQ